MWPCFWMSYVILIQTFKLWHNLTLPPCLLDGKSVCIFSVAGNATCTAGWLMQMFLKFVFNDGKCGWRFGNWITMWTVLKIYIFMIGLTSYNIFFRIAPENKTHFVSKRFLARILNLVLPYKSNFEIKINNISFLEKGNDRKYVFQSKKYHFFVKYENIWRKLILLPNVLYFLHCINVIFYR